MVVCVVCSVPGAFTITTKNYTLFCTMFANLEQNTSYKYCEFIACLRRSKIYLKLIKFNLNVLGIYYVTDYCTQNCRSYKHE